MGNCKDCKHWGVGAWDGESMLRDGYHNCALAETDYKSPNRSYGTGPVHLRTIAIAHGGDLGSYLFTSPDFGCVQFEAT